MEIDSSEPDADDDFGCDHRSLDVLAAYPIDDAEPSAQYPETLSLPPAFTSSESQYVPLEDGPSNSCDPAELNTLGLGPALIAPAETAIPTQHRLLTSDDDFQSLINYDGESSEMASPAITTRSSNASGVPAMDTLDRGSRPPTISTAEPGRLAVPVQDHPVGVMDSLHYDSSLFAETYENALLDVAQPPIYSMYPTTMPMQTMESEISTLALRISIVPDVWPNTPHPNPINLPPQHIPPYDSVQDGRAQPPISAQLPHRGHVPILPKKPVTPSSIGTPSTRKAQDTYASSEVALVPYSGTTVTKGTKKRSRSPERNGNFPVILYKFEPERNAVVAPRAPPCKRQKGTMAKKACLRCQLQNKQCSGTLPCERCLNFFETRTANYQRKTLQWTACIDSDIMQHNLFVRIPIMLCRMIDPSTSLARIYLTDEEANPLLERIKPVVGNLLQVAGDWHMEWYLPKKAVTGTLTKFDVWLAEMQMWRQFSFVGDCRTCNLPMYQGLSLASIFAMTMLFPDHLAEVAELKHWEIQQFSVWLCHVFYKETQDLISKAKKSNGQHWTQTEHLCILHYLATKTVGKCLIVEDGLQSIIIKLRRWDPIAARNAEKLIWTNLRGEDWSHLLDFTRRWLQKLAIH